MKELQTDWWAIELPEDWNAEQDEETILISDPDGLGEISLTSLQAEGAEATDADLKQLMTSLDVNPADAAKKSVADLNGYYLEFEEDEEFVREWYLRAEKLLLIVTYCCDFDNALMDRDIVDDILSTLALAKSPAEQDADA